MGLDVSNVCVNFGGIAALSEVSLAVEGGSITGLIGPNGAGKTTLFDVITGMRRADSGLISFNDRDLGNVSAYRRSQLGLGRTFQRLELFGTLTVRENVRVAASVGRRRAPLPRRTHKQYADGLTDNLLDTVGLTPVKDQRADTLPTGTGRLVELARALAIRPSVLLLDEPASGQSPEETARFGNILRTLSAHGLAILLVEHDMELVMEVCDTVYVLVQGSVLCSGPPADIQRDPDVAAAYLGKFAQVDGGP